jgi:V8-like Glu-specific endopeptidase
MVTFGSSYLPIVTMTMRRRFPVAFLVVLGVAGAGLGAGAGTAPRAGVAPSPRPALMTAERAVASAPGYWTRARMAAAASGSTTSGASGPSGASGASGVAGVPWAGGGAVARTTGRVFFTLDGTGYACSGSAVTSAGQDVVVTAAHCVSDGAGHWATHWTFVPGYDDGREPYGSYPAQTFYVPAQWSQDADEDDDVAFVVVGPAHGRDVGAVVGGQPIGFGDRAATEAVFGYPSEPPYNGRSLDYCEGTLQPDPYGLPDEGIGCTMTEGGSGGPWLSDFDPRTGLGVVTGVTTFRYTGNDATLYSADLGPVAKALYERASSG